MIKFSGEDIANQQFEVRMRGYDRQQVVEFLKGVSREFDHVVGELTQARQELKEAKHELSDYRRREASLHDALNMARQVGEQIKQQSERDAELTMADAELRAERMLSGVQNRVVALREEMFNLQEQRLRTQTELRNVLESHLKMLDLLSPTEGMQRSSIARAPRPPAEAPPAHARSGEVLQVDDADIEASAAIDEASTTAPGFAGAS